MNIIKNMKAIDDVTLIKLLGAGQFGEVYLSTKRGRKEYFATKKISRKIADSHEMKKYFDNEISLLQTFRHPNIIRLEELKKTKDFYYIVMEYANGGDLSGCLKKYKQTHSGRAFPEDIVQYLMRQIVDALKCIHKMKVIHRDLKTDNIMVHFDNEMDKNNLNMFKAKVKIIDFGLAIKVTPENLAKTFAGSPINMAPDILKKKIDNCAATRINCFQTYDEKVDIWSVGTICYELLIGEPIFNAQTLNDLIKKIELGNYVLPTNISKEMVGFLNAMIQYKSEYRLSAAELANHPFLTKRVSDFSKIDIRRVGNKIDQKGLNINIKKNQSIWAIFNAEDEKKLNGIKEPRKKRAVTEKNVNRYKPQIMNQDYNIPRRGTYGNTNNFININNNNQGYTSIGNIYMNQNPNQMNMGFQRNQMNINVNTGVQGQMINNYQIMGNFNNNMAFQSMGNNLVFPQMQMNNNINNPYININSQYSNYRPLDNDDEDNLNNCIIF